MSLNETLERIAQKKIELSARPPLSTFQQVELKAYFDAKWTYHSTAMEGSHLTSQEVATILSDFHEDKPTSYETAMILEGPTAKNKTLDDYLLAINHKRAIDFVEWLAQSNAPIKEDHVRQIHGLLFKDINDDEAGLYRNRPGTGLLTSIPFNQNVIANVIKAFTEWLNGRGKDLPPVERAALAHIHLTRAHPFGIGEGLVARLMLNLVLVREGYPAAIIRFEDLKAYASALRLAKTLEKNNRRDFVSLVADAVERSLDTYLTA